MFYSVTKQQTQLVKSVRYIYSFDGPLSCLEVHRSYKMDFFVIRIFAVPSNSNRIWHPKTPTSNDGSKLIHRYKQRIHAADCLIIANDLFVFKFISFQLWPKMT